MQGGFNKFRKKQRLIALINSFVWGIAAAIFAVGGLLLIDKLNTKSLHVVLYVLIPVATFGASSSAAWFAYKQKDKKLAKTLDERFALNDRVQTMVEFANVQTDMVRLQREDAQTRLQDISPSQLQWKGLWSTLAAFIVAVAMLVTGLAVPKKTVETTPPPPEYPTYVFEITLAQRTALGTLIKNVKESRAEDEVKTAITAELEPFLANIDEIETEIELYTELARIITVIDTFVEEHNTYKRVYQSIRNSGLETVQQFAIGLGMNALPTTFETLLAAFESEEKDGAATSAAIGEFTTELATCFADVDEVATDGLVIAMGDLIADMQTVAAIDPTVFPYDWIVDSTKKAMNDNVAALANALMAQTDNRAVTSDVIKKLISIFAMPEEWIPEWGGKPLTGLDGMQQNPNEPNKPGEGIIIDGILYPSNETVYDYYTKVICEYGKVFEGDAYNYKAAINTLISEGIANGTINPEVEEMLRAYLDALSGAEVGGGNGDESGAEQV